MSEQQNFGGMDFKSNPYMQLIQGMVQQPEQEGVSPDMSQMMGQIGQGQQQSSQSQGSGQGAPQQQNQLQPGQNPDRTKLLMGAVASLEKFITESDTREDIMLARGIVSAISRLIAKDQERFAQELG